jgi:cysteine-S-conjugate beta-lyase
MTQGAFDEVSLTELRRRRSQKWRAFPDDILPAFVAEMDFPLAPPVAAAIVNAVALGDAGYAWPIKELGEAVSGFLQARFEWTVDPTDVTLLPDVMTGITELLRLAVKPSDGVVINTPVYPPFFSHIVEAGCNVVEAPLVDGPDGYELDFTTLERAFTAGARVYLLCNPHNPTGRVFSRSELERIAELAALHDVLVLSDEVHAALALPGAVHTPFLSLGEHAAERSVAFISASKAWNIPGLKCAQVVATSDAMRALVGRLQDMTVRAGNLGVIASIAAYRDGGPWLDEVLVVIDRNRRLMGELLAKHLPAVRYTPPQGTYLAWLDCRGLWLEDEPVDVFRERGRVALGPGPKFGAQGIGWVRVTMGTSAGILRTIVERMRSAVPAAGAPDPLVRKSAGR